jgi:mannose-6-phosphate isomerase-like protein (cupin superfamily)
LGSKAFVIAGNRAELIANDGCDFSYRAAVHHVPVDTMIPALCHEAAETHLLVEHGTLEVMVNGVAAMVTAGQFLRVPAGSHFAYRNAGNTMARLLLRTVAPRPAAPPRHSKPGCAA